MIVVSIGLSVITFYINCANIYVKPIFQHLNYICHIDISSHIQLGVVGRWSTDQTTHVQYIHV